MAPTQSSAPIVSSVNPSSGPLSGGTTVTIRGANFVSGCRVKIGGTFSPQVTFKGRRTIIAVTPSQSTPGPVIVRVVNPNREAGVLPDAFQYVQPPPGPPPQVSMVTPSSGPLEGGAQVLIHGAKFTSGSTVKFGEVEATQVSFISGSKLTAITPAQATAGSFPVLIVNPDTQSATLLNAFHYVEVLMGLPHVGMVTPAAGPVVGGTKVTIFGSNFVEGSRVKFGDVEATEVSFISSSQLIAVAPAQSAAASFPVLVFNPDTQGDIVLNEFQFQAVPEPPHISGISPTSGPLAGGTEVTIFGLRFVNGSNVRFGNVMAAQVFFISDSQLIAIAPAQATTGTVSVRVINPDTFSAIVPNAFEYL